MSAATSQVRVGVRIRPLTSKETGEGGNAVVDTNPFDRTVTLSKRKFTYDSVFHSNVTQSDLYNDVAPPLLDAFLNGYNSTVLAYGQTGSGKTYTMGSEAHGDVFCANNNLQSSEGLQEGVGLIPRFMADIFAMLIQRKEASEKAVLQSSSGGEATGSGNATDALIDFSLSASFLEVYGEDIHDLLDEDRHSLPIREDSNGEVIVKGLRNTPIASEAEAMDVLNTGTLNRTTAATLMNCTSSRSHAVFTVNLQQTTRSAEGVDVTATSRFTFVDLAGSERMKKTGAEGERAKEGIKINEGLLALGNVINALADEDRLARGEKIHVPYRQSKLTRLLQDALGGNSQTLFMACVSPSDTNASETLSTLQYAHRARNIKNAPTRNVDATAVELQRLRTLTNLLKCELIKQKFDGSSLVATDPEVERNGSCVAAEDIGTVNEELLQREDVVAYMNKIEEKVTELSGGSSSTLTTSFPVHSVSSNPAVTVHRSSIFPPPSTMPSVSGRKSIQVSSQILPSADPVKQVVDEEAIILDVNPEEDLQIIDQLIELQQHDKQFQEGQKDDQDRLDHMDGEIEAQEGRLQTLREHLKVYHSMKDKYERLMCEVHSLESEKQALEEELEKAQVDPTKGCSQAIKNKMRKVEESLARARSETRKHQQMYRQAEAEAQKCKVLERKIQDLKHAKVNLTKKQREDAAKHREFTNQKTREIHALKRREKTADKKLSKMETEVQKYKNNLERSRSNNSKLSEKLKQTESHLMRLLTKKRNDLNHSAKGRDQSRARGANIHRDMEGTGHFAPVNEEVNSITFLLEKTVSDRVSLARNREAYESKVVAHGKLMQAMANEARYIHDKKKKLQAADSDSLDEIVTQIREHEEIVLELQLKIELIENDLDQLRAKCPSIEESVFEGDTADENEPTLKMMAKLDGPVLRTLLSNLLDSYVTAEIQRRTLNDRLGRKESTLKSFENEVTILNQKVDVLTKSLDQRRLGKESDPFDTIQDLEGEIQAANAKLDSCLADKTVLSTELEEMRSALILSQREHSEVAERLALLHSQKKLTEPTEGTQQMLKQLQEVLAIIGMSLEERETVRARLESCVEDACSRMLTEASTLRDEKIQQVVHSKHRITEIYAALGLEQNLPHKELPTSPQSLTNELDFLERQIQKIQPQYDDAVERRNQLANDAEKLEADLGGSLTDNLQKLIQNQRHGGQIMQKKDRLSQIPAHHRASVKSSREVRAKLFKDVEHMVKGLQTINEVCSPRLVDPHQYMSSQDVGLEDSSSSAEPGSLSAGFLDECEQDIKTLRLIKSERLLSNADMCEKVGSIAKQMHVGSDELSSIILHGLRKRDIPMWWDESVARTVYAALSKKGSILVSNKFTNHLNLIYLTIEGISHGRKLLSNTLESVIDECHRSLVSTAEGCGMDVGDLAQSLHDALASLPPLSKEHAKACIDEMNMLVEAAETVSQSEIETLTVLWEGLNESANERGRFWGELNQSTTAIEMSTASPFDNVLTECNAEVEEWVLKSTQDATRVQRKLGIRVFKLNRIHQEVKRLRRKQDMKNGIMSVNSELKLLSAKLADFEEKAGDKQRLLNKKVNSSSLLEEERFRKQMQGMFSTKLETLRQMLNEWEASEGKIDDDDMLSEVTLNILQNSHRIEAWMNEKTHLMHLRTAKTKSRQRVTLKPDRASTSIRSSSRSATSRASTAPNNMGISRESIPHNSRRLSPARSSQSTKKSPKSDLPVRSRTVKSKSSSPPRLNKPDSAPSEYQKRKALSSSTHNASQPKDTMKHISPVEVKENGSPVLLPFGNLLAETPNKEKENGSFF